MLLGFHPKSREIDAMKIEMGEVDLWKGAQMGVVKGEQVAEEVSRERKGIDGSSSVEGQVGIKALAEELTLQSGEEETSNEGEMPIRMPRFDGRVWGQ